MASGGGGCTLPCWDETDNGVPDCCLENELCFFHPHNPSVFSSLCAHP